MLVKTLVIFFTTLLLSNVFAVVSPTETWSSLVQVKERGEITFEAQTILLVNVFKVNGGGLVPLFDKELKLPSCKDKE
jgi:hypothetical protein